MDKLLAYLNSLTPDAQKAFAGRCETTIGYLRKAASVDQRLGEALCLRINVESEGAVRPEDMRPDVNWGYLRDALRYAPAHVSIDKPATDSVAQEVT